MGSDVAVGWLWRILRALAPLVVGHVAAVALVAGAVAGGMNLDRGLVQAIAGLLLVVTVALHVAAAVRHRAGSAPGAARHRMHAPASHAGLALWSFFMATSHGAGLMLVPALAPLCLSSAGPGAVPGAEDALWTALAGVGMHGAATLAVTGMAAAGISRMLGLLPEHFQHFHRGGGTTSPHMRRQTQASPRCTSPRPPALAGTMGAQLPSAPCRATTKWKL